MSLPTNHPINKKVLEALERYNAGRQKSIDLMSAKIAKDVAERQALSKELYEAGQALFERLLEELPEDQRDLFLSFNSMRICQYEVRQFSMDHTSMKIIRGSLARARKLMRPKARASKKNRHVK